MLLSLTAPHVLAYPWGFKRKCIPGAGGEQNREGTKPNSLACRRR